MNRETRRASILQDMGVLNPQNLVGCKVVGNGTEMVITGYWMEWEVDCNMEFTGRLYPVMNLQNMETGHGYGVALNILEQTHKILELGGIASV